MTQKKIKAVKMTREIRNQLSELYWNDKDSFFKKVSEASVKYNADIKNKFSKKNKK